MKITVISSDKRKCAGGNCPTVYHTDRGTFIVQGTVLDGDAAREVTLPPGEQAVEVPAALLLSIADKLKAMRAQS